jgi:tRNA(Arg) A34 adenosine deaminase TadA
MLDMLLLAAEYAAPDKDTTRTYCLGCVGVRADGCIVHARNSSVLDSVRYTKGSPYRRMPGSHAEARACKKIGFGSDMYVARVKRSGGLGLAAPCELCQVMIKAYRVERVFFTISDTAYGIWRPLTDKTIIIPE